MVFQAPAKPSRSKGIRVSDRAAARFRKLEAESLNPKTSRDFINQVAKEL